MERLFAQAGSLFAVYRLLVILNVRLSSRRRLVSGFPRLNDRPRNKFEVTRFWNVKIFNQFTSCVPSGRNLTVGGTFFRLNKS